MSAALKLLKLGFEHRAGLQQAYAKNGTDLRAHSADAAGHGYDAACETGAAVATAPLRAAENIPRLAVRGLQFLFALVMVGVYGVRLGAIRRGDSDDSTTNDSAGACWWYGVVVGVAACLASLVLAFAAPLGAVSRRCRTHHLFAVDAFLCLNWFIVFGVFFGIFHDRAGDDPYQGASVAVQRSVAWVDLVNALLWLVSAVYGGVKTWVGRRRDAVLARGREKMQDKLRTASPSSFSRQGGGAGGAAAGAGWDSDKERDAYVEYSSVSEPEHVYYQGRARTQGYHI